jgi:CheY-like chemotaxis protein
MMPQMDGFDFLEEMRRRAEWRDIPVVVAASCTSPLARAFARAVIALPMLLLLAWTAGAVTLITESEAALPSDTTAGRGISRGPRVTVVSPPPSGGLVRSPVNFRLHFETFGGAKINVESVVITYKKLPPIDLTQRVTAFITSEGIAMPVAEVPPGTHRIEVEVKDSDGRAGWADFTFRVGK